jgi:hypothetical protein
MPRKYGGAMVRPKRKATRRSVAVPGAGFPIARKGRTPDALDDLLPEAPKKALSDDTPRRARRRR